MNRIDCNVIRDLLPLYIDGACSSQSANIVKEHLESCANCRNLRDAMSADIESAAAAPALDGKGLFRHARKTLFGIIVALAVMIACLVINVGGAFEGGPAHIGELITTILYCIFWGVFTVTSRHIGPLVTTSFVISLLSTISAINGLVWRLLGEGGFIAAFISIFTSIPFYGFRYFMGWTALYAVASVLSIGWLIYTGYYRRRIERQTKQK